MDTVSENTPIETVVGSTDNLNTGLQPTTPAAEHASTGTVVGPPPATVPSTPLLGESDPQWRPLIDAFTTALQTVLHRPTTTYLPPPKPFRGTSMEDPARFFEQLEELFARDQIKPSHQTRVAASFLEGEAWKWWKPLEGCNMPFDTFKGILSDQFDPPQQRHKLQLEFHAKEQTASQSILQFVGEKTCLAQRIDPSFPEQQIVAAILELVRPEYKPFLATRPIGDLRTLIRSATMLEKQLPKPAPTTTQLPLDQRPKCRLCPGRHWHRDCPRAQGNEPGTGLPPPPEPFGRS